MKLKPHEFVAAVRAKARARAAAALAPPAPPTPAAAPVIYADDEGVSLDPAWIAEQERAETDAEQERAETDAEQRSALSVDDDGFAAAVWRRESDNAFRNPTGASPSRRVANIVSLGAASGLTDGQIEALQRLQARTDAADDVLSAAERRRATGRPQVFPGASRF